ncbi:MAG: hypothetical protein DWQ37_21435 [Planctomycetota bacterium]|nr:MAG: hypothetical protein DWQ37_21435 [Planctomycetota bacterium]
MPYRDTKTLSVRGQVHQKYSRRAAKLVNVFNCLIVSASPERSEMLKRAAADGGWKTSLCADGPAALKHVNRWLVHLVVVDLDGQPAATFRPLLEELASCRGLLSIVCGNEGDIEEEIWVRQHGAWMYLPGVSGADNSISLLCGEAKEIAERLWKPGERSPARPAAK